MPPKLWSTASIHSICRALDGVVFDETASICYTYKGMEYTVQPQAAHLTLQRMHDAQLRYP